MQVEMPVGWRLVHCWARTGATPPILDDPVDRRRLPTSAVDSGTSIPETDRFFNQASEYPALGALLLASFLMSATLDDQEMRAAQGGQPGKPGRLM
jgi:hypothetical protein